MRWSKEELLSLGSREEAAAWMAARMLANPMYAAFRDAPKTETDTQIIWLARADYDRAMGIQHMMAVHLPEYKEGPQNLGNKVITKRFAASGQTQLLGGFEETKDRGQSTIPVNVDSR